MAARKAKFQEHQMCLDWLNANKEHNDFDPAVMDYPSMELYVAPEENPIACLPIHTAAVLESIGFKQEQNTKDRLTAALELFVQARLRADQVGIKEVIYLSSDERTDEYAVKILGFRPVKAYRKVLP